MWLIYLLFLGLMQLADSYCDVTIRRECEKILMKNINKANAFFLLRSAAAANALVRGLSEFLWCL